MVIVNQLNFLLCLLGHQLLYLVLGIQYELMHPRLNIIENDYLLHL